MEGGMASGTSTKAVDSVRRLQRRGRVLAVTQSDAMVLMDLASGRYFTLNDVAGRIWELLATPRSMADIVAELAAEYDVKPERLISDVLTLTERLVELSLLVREP
jgi:hypothetical protein